MITLMYYLDDQEEDERPSSVVPGNALVVDPKLPYRPKTQKKNNINVFPIYLGSLQNCFRRSCLGLNRFPPGPLQGEQCYQSVFENFPGLETLFSTGSS